MYKILSVEDTVRIPPKSFGGDLKKVMISEYENAVAGRIEKDVGIILAVTDAEKTSEGSMIMGDGAIYYDGKFEILVYQPTLNEVVDGSVTEITEFGAFVNFGPMDGLIHISQITEDFMGFDAKAGVIAGKETKKVLKKADEVRARVIAVSLKERYSESKIGLTMRQPYLGKIEWLADERRAKEKGVDKKETKDKAPEKAKGKKGKSKK